MRKIFALLLMLSVPAVFASTDKPPKTKKTTHVVYAHGHKGGKKSKKSPNGGTPPPKHSVNKP